MKRFYIPFLLMAAAAVAACQNKAAVEEPAQGSYVFTLKATSPDLDTKTDYSSTGKFSWSEGDAISVLFHNSEGDNKFFTLTATTINGASADFSGTIDEGYEIGSSNTGNTKWALYPAGNHKYNPTAAEEKFITFNIPAVTDLTSQYSSNVPMYARGDDNNLFSFKIIDATYKFHFTGIANTVSKVKLVVENLYGTYISGDIQVKSYESSTSSPYFSPSKSVGSSQATRTFIGNVSSEGTADFYLSIRRVAENFQPKITLYDADTDDQLFTATATKAAKLENAHIQPINISLDDSPVVPWSFPSVYGLDWSTVTASAAGRADAPYDAIKVIKATGDASHLYVYFEVKEDALIDNAGYDYANYSYLYLGNEASTIPYDWQWNGNYTEKISSWIKANNSLGFINWKSYCSSNIVVHNGVVYFEIALDRSGLTCLQENSVTVAFEINSIYLVNGSDWGTQGGSNSQIGFAPTTWGPALSVTLPTYVAP